MMQALLDLIGRYDPSYSQKIHGATESELHRLEQYAHRSLPANYKEFLAHMGKDMGDFVIPWSDFTIGTVLSAYEDTEYPPPARYLFIGAHTRDPHDDYYLDCAESGSVDCRVVRFSAEADLSDPAKLYVEYPSFNDLLFSCAFKDKRLSLLPCHAMLIPSLSDEALESKESTTDSLRIVGDLATKLGFQRLPYTTDHYPLFDRQDAAIQGNQDPFRGGLYIDIAANTEQTLKKLVHTIRDHTQLVGA